MLEFRVATDPGSPDKPNEDAFAVLPTLAVVADGATSPNISATAVSTGRPGMRRTSSVSLPLPTCRIPQPRQPISWPRRSSGRLMPMPQPVTSRTPGPPRRLSPCSPCRLMGSPAGSFSVTARWSSTPVQICSLCQTIGSRIRATPNAPRLRSRVLLQIPPSTRGASTGLCSLNVRIAIGLEASGSRLLILGRDSNH